MSRVVYNEDAISSMETNSQFYSQFQGLRDQLALMEVSLDEALALLNDVCDTEDPEDMEDVMTKVRDFISNFPPPTPY